MNIFQFFYYLTILFFIFTSCNDSSFVICKDAKACNYSFHKTSFLYVEDGTQTLWYYISEDGLSPFDRIGEGESPLFFRSDDGFLISKKLSGKGLLIKVSDKERGLKRKYALPESAVGIASACEAGNEKLWFLIHDQYKNSSMKRFFLSRTDITFSQWDNYMISHDMSEQLFRKMGSHMVEKPVDISCDEDGSVFLTTFLYFKDFIQANVYRYIPEDKTLKHITNYVPLKSGKIVTYFDTKKKKLHLFQKREYITQKGLGYPVKSYFSEPGDAFIFDDDESPAIFYIPETESGSVVGRFHRKVSRQNKEQK